MAEPSNDDDTQPPMVDPPLTGSSSQHPDDSQAINNGKPALPVAIEKDEILAICQDLLALLKRLDQATAGTNGTLLEAKDSPILK